MAIHPSWEATGGKILSEAKKLVNSFINPFKPILSLQGNTFIFMIWVLIFIVIFIIHNKVRVYVTPTDGAVIQSTEALSTNTGVPAGQYGSRNWGNLTDNTSGATVGLFSGGISVTLRCLWCGCSIGVCVYITRTWVRAWTWLVPTLLVNVVPIRHVQLL